MKGTQWHDWANKMTETNFLQQMTRLEFLMMALSKSRFKKEMVMKWLTNKILGKWSQVVGGNMLESFKRSLDTFLD